MKKLLSISFAILILLSGMHFTISTHYCGGLIAASKASILGEFSSCGMEGCDNNSHLPGKHFSTHCCDDKVSVLAVDNNYSPSFSEFKVISQHILQVFNIPACLRIYSLTAVNLISTSVSPPGNFMVSAVNLPYICVFRNWCYCLPRF